MPIPLPRTRDLVEFRERYRARGQACVVEGALAEMPASRWTTEYLGEALIEHRPTVRLDNGRLALMNMRDYFRYFEVSDKVRSSGGAAYLRDFYLRPSFGEASRARVAADIRYPLVTEAEWPAWRRAHREWMTLYCGPKGTRSPLHIDMFRTSTWLAEIAGQKAWRVAPPEALTEKVALATDAFGPGPHPCDFFETVLSPGDVIFLPPCWWHAVENRTATIAVSGNFCTLEEARACLAEVEALPEGSERDVWLKTWRAILEEEEDGAPALVA